MRINVDYNQNRFDPFAQKVNAVSDLTEEHVSEKIIGVFLKN